MSKITASPKIKIALLIVVPALVAFSAAMIFDQFVLHHDPFIHHAFVCTTIFAVAAFYARQFGTSKIIRAAIFFAVGGMMLGLFEAGTLIFGMTR